MRRDREKMNKQGGWMKLDNAAKIYPPVTRGELTSVFRLTAIINAPVKITVLQQSVKEAALLFPSFSVELCQGIFWYYLEYNGLPPRIHLDEGTPCQAFPKSKGEVMYRILARENCISAEFLHVITDGGGALLFLKTLLNIYHRNCSKKADNELLFPDAPIAESKEGTEDKFKKISRKKFPHPDHLAPAWHLQFQTRAATPRFKAMSFCVPTDKLIDKVKDYNATITEFLTATYLCSLQDLREKEKKGSKFLRVQVPVDLRRRYNEKTTRNFSAFVLPEIDLRMGSYSFEEIIHEVRIAIALMASEKRLTKIISRNVAKEESPFIRITPLLLKQVVLRIAYNRFGISQYSGTITNMGKIDASEKGSRDINSIIVIPPPPHPRVKITCAVVTFGNNTILTFGSVTGDTTFERTFMKLLTGKGIPVKVFQIR